MAIRRGKGEGSIFEHKKTRKDGSIYSRWCAEIVTGYDKYNDKIVKRVYGDSKQEVIEMKNQLLSEKQKGLLPETKGITLNKYIEHWLEMKQNAVKTKTYESYVATCKNHIKDSIGKSKLQKITTVQLNSYFAKKIKDGLSDASIKRLRAIISNIMNSAIDEGVLVVNPTTRCKPVKNNTKHEINILTQQEITKILDIAKIYYGKKGVKLKFIYHAVLLALASGFRRGEILGLRWDNVNFQNNTISIIENLVEVEGGVKFEQPKTQSSKRTIAIAQNVMNELAEYKEKTNTCDLVFHTASNQPLSPSNLSRGFRYLVAEAKLPHHVRFHDLRHTHATQLLAAGLNIKQISVRLGHENINITLHTYSHFMPAQDRQAADIMGGMLINEAPQITPAN